MDSFPGGSVVKNLPINAGDVVNVQSLGGEDPPGEGNGKPLRYSWLGNPMDRGGRWAADHGVTKSQI